MSSGLVFGFGIISFIGILIVTFIIEVSNKLRNKMSEEDDNAEQFLGLLNKNKGLICFGLLISIVGILGFTISMLIK